ncbi:MAG: GxxExxY protein [Sedimentisphaerales bacterium]|nr:GxxExxY protein [Sedimentisphaerales bacterium]
MHPDYERADEWSNKVIGAAIEVHRDKGPGLLESIYEKCLLHELELRNIPAEKQVPIKVEYKDLVFDESLRLDVYVDQCLIVELKAVEKTLPIHKAQILSYMKLLNSPLGLILNFHKMTLTEGISRLILPNSDADVKSSDQP